MTVANSPTSTPDTHLESDTLYAIIGVVGSSPSLDRVLNGVVDLLTQATACHACFVYILQGDRLRLRAASRPFAHLVGRVEMGRHEGVAGWVAREGRPEFIRDDALTDPRMKYVPEMQEERFQSLAAVPIPARSGETLGVVVLHTVAPHEFEEGVITLLTHTASLVAGAVENAALYEDARRRVERLAELSRLGQRIAAVVRREELYRTVTGGVRSLLACGSAELYLLDDATGALERTAADPHDGASQATTALLELLRRRSSTDQTVVARVAAGDDELGVLVASDCERAGPEADELLQAVANQLAVAQKKAELIERLTAENLVRDLFGAMEAGATDVAEAWARAAGCDLMLRHMVVHLETPSAETRPWPAVAERAEARLRRLHPAALADEGHTYLRALVPLAPGADPADVERALNDLASAERLHAGLSGVRLGVQDGRESLREAADAAQIAGALLRGRGGALRYRDLGTYKYLVRLPLDEAPHDRHCSVVERLMAYDRRRRSHLVDTLQQYLQQRGSIATTAKALYIHPNTLRQRLGRIEKLCDLRLAEEDLLSLDIATKLVRLRAAAAEDART